MKPFYLCVDSSLTSIGDQLPIHLEFQTVASRVILLCDYCLTYEPNLIHCSVLCTIRWSVVKNSSFELSFETLINQYNRLTFDAIISTHLESSLKVLPLCRAVPAGDQELSSAYDLQVYEYDFSNFQIIYLPCWHSALFSERPHIPNLISTWSRITWKSPRWPSG